MTIYWENRVHTFVHAYAGFCQKPLAAKGKNKSTAVGEFSTFQELVLLSSLHESTESVG